MNAKSVATPIITLRWGWLALALIWALVGCNKGEQELEEPVEVAPPKISLDKVAICMYPLVYVREEASGKQERITDISYFEEVEMLPEKAQKGNVHYMKVKLSDREEGWVKEYPFEKHARLAVLLEETETYRRPQAMTIMDNKIQAGEIVAVIFGPDSSNLVDGWYKVSTAKKNHKGWIKDGSHISFTNSHIKPAFKIFTALKKSNPQARFDRLEELANEPLVASSPFKDLLQSHIAELAPKVNITSPDTENLEQGQKVFIVESQVPVFKSPGENDDEDNVVKELERNDEVTVLAIAKAPSRGKDNALWLKIEHDGTMGWVEEGLTGKQPIN